MGRSSRGIGGHDKGPVEAVLPRAELARLLEWVNSHAAAECLVLLKFSVDVYLLPTYKIDIDSCDPLRSSQGEDGISSEERILRRCCE